MKYLFINTVAGFGSTGRIAAEKCRELMAQGHECVLAYGRNKANCEDIPTIRIGSPLDYKLHGVRTRLLDQHGFGSRAATRRFLQQVRAYDPDVIWLHNVHGYYIHLGLLFTYLKTCGKKIYWTLHDCWTFTGHCSHYMFVQCEKWKTGCYGCPQKREYPASFGLDQSRQNYRKKKALFTGIPNLTVITPSQWLCDQVRQSFLREYPVEVRYNTINTDVFKPTPGDFRTQYALEGKFLVLGVASVWSERKGLKDFLRLADMLDDAYRIVLVGVSEEQAKQLPANVIPIPRTNSVQELAQIYTAADVFVSPSYEENYPTVHLEAQACGTPAVCYDVGGSKETLQPFSRLVPMGAEYLYQAVTALCEGTTEKQEEMLR